MLSPIKVIIALLMIFFALFEVIPVLKKLKFGKDKLAIGGLISGFFGGLSGHQGALRSAFLLRYGLNKEAFIATGIIIATFIDITRLSVYFSRLSKLNILENLPPLLTAVFAAFLGAYLGQRLLQKVTLEVVQWIVVVLILILAIGLGMGII